MSCTMINLSRWSMVISAGVRLICHKDLFSVPNVAPSLWIPKPQSCDILLYWSYDAGEWFNELSSDLDYWQWCSLAGTHIPLVSSPNLPNNHQFYFLLLPFTSQKIFFSQCMWPFCSCSLFCLKWFLFPLCTWNPFCSSVPSLKASSSGISFLSLLLRSLLIFHLASNYLLFVSLLINLFIYHLSTHPPKAHDNYCVMNKCRNGK